MTQFKEGDKVRLKEKFYDEPYFKSCDRFMRKEYAKLLGKEFTVSTKGFTTKKGYYVRLNEMMFKISPHESMLELVLPETQITGVWFDECTEYPPKKPAMRKWTAAEITEAKVIACELFFGELYGKLFSYNFKETVCSIRVNGVEFTARPCRTDEPNINIGRMVVLCKATGRPFPDWIRKESK